MSAGIFVIQENGQLVEMAERAYDSEALLQELLEKYPNLLAGDQINSGEPRRWLLISREMGVPFEEAGAGRWFVDHLFLDQDGILTLVEVKRSSDTRIRREVVGQMLDYAANGVVHWTAERIRASFEANCQTQAQEPEEVLAEFLDGDADTEKFWQQVATNLQIGKIRMLFVADQIPLELQRVVEFLNVQMNPAEVLAVEIKQFVGEGLKTLVPRVIGQTVEAQKNKTLTSSASRQWDEASFRQALESRQGGTELAEIADKLLDWARRKELYLWRGKGSKYGSVMPILSHRGVDYQLFSIWTTGSIEIGFQYLQNKHPFDVESKRVELLTRLNEIEGISLPESVITKRPSLPLAVLKPEASLQQFLAVFDWVIDQVKLD
ncbi:hypothetical protein NIES2135_26200 [Leptolyngbya boryana NIES-2135]|jgi:hypothetical protein|uniref:DUF91 domain-containing protein n=1 Tax=Leptolyngbya boryana NIES-2135 TaxID=1973484 RepID=A0A1Z4JGB3_LEPBY|nr:MULTISPECIES: hypothetical protein [Leptolyngbya]BAY55796.1 hypothetical protein NIES2135_26200 [Leptolyngbya boryana NIES-2135]MBD2368899.1 hypothetical protein [Leptolyngbya sp. FACHB-161]MBD2375233.1 hypothetical protein [Leptolyngbya sp. FACHB-238]MBD2399651.1 hypothetical protein [Leptolyngbya sp. FACHB-239]MBD2405857.1 hypothetical protein [Leptolyngbya sp. FACHB-402]